MPAARIGTFDDWVDLFRVWRNDIGVNYPEIESYQFEAKFGPTRSNEIEFGAFKGRPKWQAVLRDSRPANSRRPAQLDRLSGRHGVRVRGAAAAALRTFAERARPANRSAAW